MIIKKIVRRLKLFRDLRYYPFFFQRLFTRYSTRERLANLVALTKPAPVLIAKSNDPAFSDIEHCGIHFYGQLLSQSNVLDVKNWLNQRPVKDDYRPGWPQFLPDSDQRHPHCHVAFHAAQDVIQAPHLLALANRGDILATAAHFLGCKPTISYLAAVQSYTTETGPQEAENFHRDVDDWRFLKFFVYLTDVGEDDGPHTYVQNSVNSQRLTEIRRFTDHEVVEACGAENILTIIDVAGTGFAENTFGIHKAKPPSGGRRLLFQAVYSVGIVPYGPRSPISSLSEASALHGLTLDPYVNRVYLSS